MTSDCKGLTIGILLAAVPSQDGTSSCAPSKPTEIKRESGEKAAKCCKDHGSWDEKRSRLIPANNVYDSFFYSKSESGPALTPVGELSNRLRNFFLTETLSTGNALNRKHSELETPAVN